jgi:hypothetical protein
MARISVATVSLLDENFSLPGLSFFVAALSERRIIL